MQEIALKFYQESFEQPLISNTKHLLVFMQQLMLTNKTAGFYTKPVLLTDAELNDL